MFRILPAWGCSDKMAVSLTVPGSAGWVVPPVQAVRAVSGFNPVPESAPSRISALCPLVRGDGRRLGAVLAGPRSPE